MLASLAKCGAGARRTNWKRLVCLGVITYGAILNQAATFIRRLFARGAFLGWCFCRLVCGSAVLVETWLSLLVVFFVADRLSWL